MIKNFIVHDNGVELECNGQSFDLHNRYDFSAARLSSTAAYLAFRPNPEFGKGLPPIHLEFQGLDYSAVSLDFTIPDHLIVDEIGYKSPGDHDMDWLDGENHAEPDAHLVFRFIDEGNIRLHCAEVTLQVDNSAELNS